MRIGMLLLTKYPPDIRVDKEIFSLSKMHEIFLLCPNRGQIKLEKRNGIMVNRIFNNFKRWISNIELLYFKRSFLWESEILNFVKANSIEVLHVHDLPLAKSAYIISKKTNLKLVIDLHENYPAMINDFHLSSQSPFKSISNFTKYFTSYKSWKLYEEFILKKINNIIVVIEEAKSRLIQDYNISPSRVHIVPNYHLQFVKSKIDNKDFTCEKLKFLYTGGIDYTRDIQTLIYAISFLDDKYLNQIEIYIVGASKTEKVELECLLQELNITKGIVNIIEFMPFDKLHEFFNNSHIGLIPHVKSPHTSSTIPHKLFQYFYYGLPVLVSDCEPLVRIVQNSNCGFVYNSRNASNLSHIISHIIDNRDNLSMISFNAKQAESSIYNWDKAEASILNLYNNLK